MQIWPNLQHTFACCFFSSLSKGFIFSGITPGIVLLLSVYWLLDLDHPTRILVAGCGVNWGCSQLLGAIGLCNPSMTMLRLDWMVGWGRPLHVELDDIIPGFIWSVSGVNNPRAPWCHGFTTLVLEPMCLVYHLSHGAGSSWVIPIWYWCVTEVVYHLTSCGIIPGFIPVVKNCVTEMHKPWIGSFTLSIGVSMLSRTILLCLQAVFWEWQFFWARGCGFPWYFRDNWLFN